MRVARNLPNLEIKERGSLKEKEKIILQSRKKERKLLVNIFQKRPWWRPLVEITSRNEINYCCNSTRNKIWFRWWIQNHNHGNGSTSSSSNPIASQNDKERSEPFHVRFITKHIKVDTLFDSGSQVNLISEAIAKKLDLETTPHTKRYHLGWVRDDAKLQVTRKCKLKFAITANFIDKVELGVVPLDICGILIGSPYLCDWKAIFYHHENKYHLFKDVV